MTGKGKPEFTGGLSRYYFGDIHNFSILNMINSYGKILVLINELIIRVLLDTRPETIVEGASLISQTIDNQNSVFFAAKSILPKKFAEKILFVKTGPISGYPGFSTWKSELCQLGIPSNEIIGTELMEISSLNTLIESEAIFHFAVQKGYHSLSEVSG